MTARRSPNRAVVGPDINGEVLFAEAQHIANAADVGSMGRGTAVSGFTVGGTAVELTAGLPYRKVIAINNQGADTVFLGPNSGEAITSMYPVAGSGGQISFNVTSGVSIWGITDGTNTDIRIIEIG